MSERGKTPDYIYINVDICAISTDEFALLDELEKYGDLNVGCMEDWDVLIIKGEERLEFRTVDEALEYLRKNVKRPTE
jgi:hypothetical protein